MFCSETMAEKIMYKKNGTLDISDTWITQLPDDFTVRGDLILNRYIKELPDKLVVEGNLDLRDTLVDLQSTSQLNVYGNLYTGPYTTGFKWIVDVGGNLDLRASRSLQSIDNGCLIVHGNLYLDGNNKYITSIRQTLGVVGDLILKGSCVEVFADGRLIHAQSVDLSDSAIKRLPDDFVVYGDLDVSNTRLTQYPDRMVVFGNLNISGTRLSIPSNGVIVVGKIYSDDFYGEHKKNSLKSINTNSF